MIKILKWLIILFLLWLGYLFFSIFSYPIGKMDNSANVAIVLGAAVYKNKPSPVFAERLNHAINLYHSGHVQKLLFTGGSSDKNIPAESIVAKEYALSRDVTLDDIYVETQSVTTYQNLFFAKQLLESFNLKNALIISDSFHLKRAMLMANALGIDAKPSATSTSRYKSLKTQLPFALRELYFYHHFLIFDE